MLYANVISIGEIAWSLSVWLAAVLTQGPFVGFVDCRSTLPLHWPILRPWIPIGADVEERRGKTEMETTYKCG